MEKKYKLIRDYETPFGIYSTGYTRPAKDFAEILGVTEYAFERQISSGLFDSWFKVVPVPKNKCIWIFDMDGFYHTGCGGRVWLHEKIYLTKFPILEVKYCSFCGKRSWVDESYNED